MDATELANEAVVRHGTYRAAAAAVGVPYPTLYRMAHGGNVGKATELRVGRALGVYPPARKVRRVTLASIPLAAIEHCAMIASMHSEIPECAESAAAVTRWLERVGR